MNSRSARPRIEWIDVAKGFCIALVVLGHTVEWYSRAFTGSEPEIWSFLWIGLRPLRMPLFFMISGMLAVGAMRKPYRELWSKTGGLYALYCLWQIIYCVKLALPGGREGLPYPDAAQILGAFLLPTTLWYIWALPVFYTLAWVLDRWLGKNSVYALIPMLALAIAAPWIGQATENMLGPPLFVVQSRAVPGNLVWFYLGLQARPLITGIAAGTTLPRLLASTALALAVIVLVRYFDDDRLLVVATPFVLWAALEWLGRVRADAPYARPLAKVGRNTLPVYVLHTFVLTGLSFVVRALHIGDRLPVSAMWLQIVLPVCMTAALVVACLWAGRLFARMGLGFLTEPAPSPFRSRKPRAELVAADRATL